MLEMLSALLLTIYVLALPVAIFLLIMSQPKVVAKVAKYEVGDAVTYNRGRWAKFFGNDQTVDAVVESVSTGHNGLSYMRPLYTVRWISAWQHISPVGRATIYEDRLSD